jgi:hypothetical protein
MAYFNLKGIPDEQLAEVLILARTQGAKDVGWQSFKY